MLSEAWLRRIRRFLGEVICKSGPKEEAQEGVCYAGCVLYSSSVLASEIIYKDNEGLLQAVW